MPISTQEPITEKPYVKNANPTAATVDVTTTGDTSLHSHVMLNLAVNVFLTVKEMNE
jgi:hypothetical protein